MDAVIEGERRVLVDRKSELYCVERRARAGGRFVAIGNKAETYQAAREYAAKIEERMGGKCRVVREVKVDFREVVV